MLPVSGAEQLSVSEATVKAHVTAIFRKLGVRTRTQAALLLQLSRTTLIDKLQRLESLRAQFGRLRFALESLTFTYTIPGAEPRDSVRRRRVPCLDHDLGTDSGRISHRDSDARQFHRVRFLVSDTQDSTLRHLLVIESPRVGFGNALDAGFSACPSLTTLSA